MPGLDPFPLAPPTPAPPELVWPGRGPAPLQASPPVVVTHRLATDMMVRTKRAEFIDHLHAFGALATKLLRTYTMQTEALAKLKRGGEQTVRVEHVHVYPGAQAIVGAVSTQRAEGGVADERGNQADGAIDARAIAFAPGAALFDPAAGRDAPR